MAKNKSVKQKEFQSKGKEPRIAQDPNAYLSQRPTWRFSRCDLNHPKWSILNASFENEILPKLAAFEGLTWAEIQSASGAKRDGTNNHFENISDMSKEARDRARELKLDVDQLFSLHLTGRIRLYGILDRGIFYILWFDREHEVYPSTKR